MAVYAVAFSLMGSVAARKCAPAVTALPRVDAATLSGEALLRDYVLRDVPVVLENAVGSDVLGALGALAPWAAGAAPAALRRALAEAVVARDGAVALANETAGAEGAPRWGCAGSDGACALRDVAGGLRGRIGGFPATDAMCVPAWSLQVVGEAAWTVHRRTADELGVPLGEAFGSARVYSGATYPGDLLVFYAGWQPYAARPTPGARSARGAVSVGDGARDLLWNGDGVRAKAALGVVGPSLDAACPDVRDAGGFAGAARAPGGEEAAATGGCDRFGARVRASSLGGIDVGYYAAPALGDVDGDGDYDLVVGDAGGRVSYYENVGDERAHDFVEAASVYGAAALAVPALGDLDGDSLPELAVGGIDGGIAFFDQNLERFLAPLVFRVGRVESGPIQDTVQRECLGTNFQ